MGELNKRKMLSNKRTLKTKNHKIFVKLAVAFVIVLIASGVYFKYLQPHTNEAKQRIQLESTQQQLIETEQLLQSKQTESEAQFNQKQLELEQVKQKLEETEKALQAKRHTQRVLAAELPQPKVASVVNCGDNAYKQYIYQHESGCRTNAVNSIGCTGIGQACPGSKIKNACPDLSFECQDAWFSNYAIQRYGSWEKAYNFWIANRWW